MPKFKLTLDDGRSIVATADNQADAVSAANKWAKANPPGSGDKALSYARRAVADIPDPIRSITQGGTLSFGDEAVAGVAGLVTGARRALGRDPGYTAREAYDAAMQAQKEARTGFQKEHPIADIGLQIGGGLLTPGVGLAGRFVEKAPTLLGATGRSALVGASFGAVAGAGSADGGIAKRSQGAAAGGVTGGLIGAAVPAVTQTARSAVGLIRRSRGVDIDETAAMAEVADALDEARIDVRSVSQASMGRIRDLIRQGRSPREAALSVVATNDLPVPVPLTRGQRTGEPGQQLSENLMLRGARGSAASRQMRGLVSEQQEALRANTEVIGEQIAGRPIARGAGAQSAAERLNQLYDTADEGVSGAYRAARAASGDAALPAGERATASSRLMEAVGDFDEIDVAPVYRVIEQVGDPKALTARKLFDARSRFVALQSGGDRTAVAAGKAKRALDGYIDEAMDRDLFSGDAEAVKLWREAIGARRDFGRRFESGDLVEKLTERVPGDKSTMKVDPGDAANYILGRSDMGFVGKQNLYRGMARLRDTLGPDSPEWNGIRAEVFQRLASSGEGPVEFGSRQFSGVKFAKAWEDFQAKDARLAAAMFTPAERDLITRFARIAARVTSPVKGGDNPSNTAVTGMRLLGNLKFLRGLPFIKDFATEVEVQMNLGQARQATSQTVGRAARAAARRGPLTGTTSAVVGGASGRYAGGMIQ